MHLINFAARKRILADIKFLSFLLNIINDVTFANRGNFFFAVRSIFLPDIYFIEICNCLAHF